MTEARPTPPASAPARAGLVRMKPEPARLARRGQPWFYADDLLDPVPGDAMVRVHDHEGRDLGLGITSKRSKLALRLCGPWEGEGIPDREAFFARRLAAALDRRAHLLGPEDGARLVHGEADALPGLVVDRYGSALVLQVTAAAVESWLDAIVPFLVERLQPRAVIARNDVGTRRFEGLPQEVRLLHGTQLETVDIVEHGVRHAIRPWGGHKTGFYLDQRQSRRTLSRYTSAQRVLNVFAYTGAFSVVAWASGAASVTSIDSSSPALSIAAANLRLNGFPDTHLVTADAFTELRRRRDRGEQFDLVILDPPKLVGSKQQVDRGARAYKDLNWLALRLLAPGGTLMTFSCSGAMSADLFQKIVADAAVDAEREVQILERLDQATDHPVLLSVPETHYLKGLVCRVL